MRFYNEYGQPIGLYGNPGPNADTHIPLNTNWTYPLPKDGDMVLRLDGQRVTKVCFDYAVLLATESGFELRFETPFVLQDPDGEQALVDPEVPGELAARVLQVLQLLIDSADVAPSGALTVTFVDGHELAAHPHPEFEAWTVVGPTGQRVVCLPGGGFSEWSSTD